jgi:hypothetical protein
MCGLCEADVKQTCGSRETDRFRADSALSSDSAKRVRKNGTHLHGKKTIRETLEVRVLPNKDQTGR